MDVSFDRARPDDDRFEVTLFDGTGKLVRTERYARQEVETTFAALFKDPPPPKAPRAADPPGVAARWAEYDARWGRILEVFPRPKDEQRPIGARPG